MESRILRWVCQVTLIMGMAGCAIATMNYSPRSATADAAGPGVPVLITVDSYLRPNTAVVVRAKQPISESDHIQWVQLDLPVATGTAARKITGVEVCYQINTDSPGSTYISQTRLTEMTTPDQAQIRVDDPTNRTDRGPACYSVAAAISPIGSIVLHIKVIFGNTRDEIVLGAVRLFFGS